MNLSQPESSPTVPEESHYVPLSADKRALSDLLLAAGLPVRLSLDAARREHRAIDRIRRHSIEQFGDVPSLCEFEAQLLTSPDCSELRDWPAWYVRLPEVWRDDVPRLVARGELNPHLQRDEHDPWYVAQHVAIVSEFLGSNVFADARRIEVDDRDVVWTFSKGSRREGLLVIFECAETISLSAYPLDECLMGALLAGEGASSRHPLFDLSLAQVQFMTRAIEDGASPVCNPNVVRLPANRLLGAEAEREARRWSRWRHGVPHRLGPRVRCALQSDGALGRLSDVVAWHPDDWCDEGGEWLRLTVPSGLHDLFAAELPMARVQFLLAVGDAPDMMLVTLSRGPHLYAAELRLCDPALNLALRWMAISGCCRLVLESLSSGRLLRLELQWPSQELPDVVLGESRRSAADIIEAAEHPAVYAQAEALATQLGDTVFLYRCLVRAGDGVSPQG